MTTKKALVTASLFLLVVFVGIAWRHFFVEKRSVPYAPDLARLDETYYEFQKIYAEGLSEEMCDVYLADAQYKEWHDDLLYRSALLKRTTDAREAERRMLRIVQEFPQAICEQEIAMIGVPGEMHSDSFLEYIRLHPTFTAEHAMLWLGYFELHNKKDHQKAAEWFERLLANTEGNPRYDDTLYRMSGDLIVRPYVAAAEHLYTLYLDHKPEKLGALIEQLTSENQLPMIRQYALIRGAELAVRNGDIKKAKEMATVLLEKYPSSDFADDARSLKDLDENGGQS